METIAFTMQLRPGAADEYKRRHDLIWPTLRTTLHEAGIRNYTIYLNRATGTLFAVQTRLDRHASEALPALPIMQQWWAYMADLMETNPDASPVIEPLEPVFFLA